MNTRWEIRLAVTLIIILVLISISGCGQVPMATDRILEQHQAEDNTPQEQSAPNFQGIANAITCVFAPQSCGKEN